MREGPPARRPPSGQGQPPAAPGWTALLPKEPPRLGTSCSFRQGCKRRERNRSSRQDGVGSRAGLSCSLACCSPGLGSTWNFRTFPYLVLARLALVPTQIASTVQIADVSGWAFHGPIEQKAKLRTPVGPRAKGAIYCPQPQRLIPDLPTTERSPLPRYIHSAVGRLHPLTRPPWRLPCLHSAQGQQCYLPALGGWRPGHPHGLSETQTPVRTGSGVSITARLRGSAQVLLLPVTGRRTHLMGRSAERGFLEPVWGPGSRAKC